MRLRHSRRAVPLFRHRCRFDGFVRSLEHPDPTGHVDRSQSFDSVDIASSLNDADHAWPTNAGSRREQTAALDWRTPELTGRPGTPHQVIVNCMRYLREHLDEILEINRQGDVLNCAITSYHAVCSRDDADALQLDLVNFLVPPREAATPVTTAADVPSAVKP
ncbi:hypothetical protein QTI24_29455 [Variovorax sp. J22P240]|uniref:hypothetical protein n=1 Tax=Variovorax sp. J22P240 TaxID=3053514 RepID=UPI002574B19C|nr:hypothetical protein [Variovorax sp. J22P240]MDM0002755.1 hypothetical protein [Variovorax sp. J22P240]